MKGNHGLSILDASLQGERLLRPAAAQQVGRVVGFRTCGTKWLRVLRTLALVILMAGCTPIPADEQSYVTRIEENKQECDDLPAPTQELCRDLVGRRAANYDAFLAQSEGFLSASERRRLGARVYDDTTQVRELLQDGEVTIQVVCRMRDIGRVDCVSLASLLAYYDTQMDTWILQDMKRLGEVLELDHRHEILLACGPGYWTSAGLADFASPDVSEFLGSMSGDVADAMFDICAKFGGGGGGSGTTPGGGSGGFSGVTGIGPLGQGGICGMEITTSAGSFDAFMEAAWTMLEAFHTTCESSLGETIAEGDVIDGLELEPIPNIESPPPGAELEGSITEVQDNGDGTTTTTTTTAYSDGTIVTTKVTTNNETGEKVSESRREENVNDGTYSEHQVQHKSDDTHDHMRLQHDHLDTTVVETWTTDDEGNSSNYSAMIVTADGRSWYAPPGGRLRRVRDCGDDVCGSCVDFAALMPGLAHDCMAAGGATPLCAAFASQANCCSNPDAFPGDPRVMMPNPDGDLACMGGVDEDLQDSYCQTQCMVADAEEDCQSNCKSASAFSVLEFNLLDLICREAYSEDCFSASSSLPVPGGEVPGIVDPQPIPVDAPTLSVAVLDHLLLPPVEPWEGIAPEIP